MRFVLDHNVDAAVCAEIQSRGHDCWRAPDGLAQHGRDDEITIYAVDKSAVVISHDREFAARRRRYPLGVHIRLRCAEPDAVAVIAEWFDELLTSMYHQHCVINVSKNGVEVIPPAH